MFGEMLDRVKRDVISIVSRVQIRTEEEVEAIERRRREAAAAKMQLQHAEAQSVMAGGGGTASAGPLAQGMAVGRPPQGPAPEPFVREEKKVGRNEPCPCGSGKKYKHCHGRLN
jgi:preprotein translocase subunit SecA